MTCTKCAHPIIAGIPYHRTQRGAHHAVCPPKPKEAEIQAAITQVLELDGWRALRTDPTSDRTRGKGFGELGMADHIYIRYLNSANPNVSVWGTIRRMYDPLAEVLWIEHKRPKGRVSTHQRIWHEAERARGALTLIAGVDFQPATLDGFIAWYRNSGLMRKDIRL